MPLGQTVQGSQHARHAYHDHHGSHIYPLLYKDRNRAVAVLAVKCPLFLSETGHFFKIFDGSADT